MANVYDQSAGTGAPMTMEDIERARRMWAGEDVSIQPPAPVAAPATAAPAPAPIPEVAPAPAPPQTRLHAARLASPVVAPPAPPAPKPAVNPMDAELLSMPAAKPAPAPGQNMNLGNWRPELLKSIDSSSAAQTRIAGDEAGQLEEANRGIERIGAMHQMDLEASNERKRLAQEEWDADRPRLMADVDRFDNEASKQVIKDRRSGMQKAMGAVALGLGQMTDQNNLVAGLMQGTPVYTNNADSIQDNLNAAMDRDIDVQRENLANSRDSAQAARSQLGMARTFFQDDQAAEDYTRATLNEEYSQHLDELAKTLTNDQARQRVLSAAEDMRLKGTEAKAQLFAQWEAQKKAEAAARAAARAKGPDWSKFKPSEIKAAIDLDAAPAGAVEYYNKVVSGGLKNDEAVAGIQATQAKTNKESGPPELKAEQAKMLQLYDSAETDAGKLRDLVAKLDNKQSSDVPGVGPLAGMMPNWATSSEGVATRQQVKRVVKAMLRAESGAAIGDDELEGYINDRGLSETATNADFMAGLRDTLREFESKRDLAREAAGRSTGPVQTEREQMIRKAISAYGARPRSE